MSALLFVNSIENTENLWIECHLPQLFSQCTVNMGI